MCEKQLTVFDFDGTLIKGDSFILFAHFAVGLPKFLIALFRSSAKLVKWKLGLCDGGTAKEVLFGNLFRGMPEAEFKRLGAAFAQRLTTVERHETMWSVKEFCKRGIPVIIVTASVPAWVEPWARQYGVVKVIGTEVETNDYGLLTGRFSTPNCRGIEKVRRLESAVADLSEFEIWAYGDSSGDDALLAFATHSQKL